MVQRPSGDWAEQTQDWTSSFPASRLHGVDLELATLRLAPVVAVRASVAPAFVELAFVALALVEQQPGRALIAIHFVPERQIASCSVDKQSQLAPS